MDFHHITVLEDMVSLNHLTVKDLFAPYPGKLQVRDKIFMYLYGQVLQGAFLGKDKGMIRIVLLAGGLGEDPNNIRKVINQLNKTLQILSSLC
jgi:hypothetical protein